MQAKSAANPKPQSPSTEAEDLPDENGIDGRPAAQAEVTAMMARLSRMKDAYQVNADTKFVKMKRIFDSGRAFPIKNVQVELALAGKCVSKASPETFYSSLANVYVENDEVLGRQVYFMPLSDKSREARDYTQLSDAEAWTFQEKRRGEKDSFSALSPKLPSHSPLSNFMAARLSFGLFSSYQPPASAKAGKGSKTEANGALYNLRVGSEGGKSFPIIESLCPYYPGCSEGGDNIVDYMNYMDGYSYCYYTKIFKFKKNGTSPARDVGALKGQKKS